MNDAINSVILTFRAFFSWIFTTPEIVPGVTYGYVLFGISLMSAVLATLAARTNKGGTTRIIEREKERKPEND